MPLKKRWNFSAGGHGLGLAADDAVEGGKEAEHALLLFGLELGGGAGLVLLRGLGGLRVWASGAVVWRRGGLLLAEGSGAGSDCELE